MPDIVLHLPGGQTCFLELKAPGGRLSPEQKRFMEQVTAIGCLTPVAFGVDEAVAALRVWGAIRQSATP